MGESRKGKDRCCGKTRFQLFKSCLPVFIPFKLGVIPRVKGEAIVANFSTNLWQYKLAKPINTGTFLTLRGRGKSQTSLIVLGFGCIPSFETICPRKHTDDCPKKHFWGFKVRFAERSQSNTQRSRAR